MTLSDFFNALVVFLNAAIPFWQVALLGVTVIGGALIILSLIYASRS